MRSKYRVIACLQTGKINPDWIDIDFSVLPSAQVSTLKVMVDKRDKMDSKVQKGEKGDKGGPGEPGQRGQPGLNVSSYGHFSYV